VPEHSGNRIKSGKDFVLSDVPIPTLHPTSQLHRYELNSFESTTIRLRLERLTDHVAEFFLRTFDADAGVFLVLDIFRVFGEQFVQCPIVYTFDFRGIGIDSRLKLRLHLQRKLPRLIYRLDAIFAKADVS
jgi:hypothetical protein